MFDYVMVQWFNGSMVQWFNGSMVQWFNGSMVQWFNGSMVQWYSILESQMLMRFYGKSFKDYLIHSASNIL